MRLIIIQRLNLQLSPAYIYIYMVNDSLVRICMDGSASFSGQNVDMHLIHQFAICAETHPHRSRALNPSLI